MDRNLISRQEAKLLLHKWIIEQTPVVILAVSKNPSFRFSLKANIIGLTPKGRLTIGTAEEDFLIAQVSSRCTFEYEEIKDFPPEWKGIFESEAVSGLSIQFPEAGFLTIFEKPVG